MYLENIWAENVLTAEGKLMHGKVDDSGSPCRAGVIQARGLRLRSLKWGLVGKADLVEFELSEKAPNTCRLRERDGFWKVRPVEYKHGKPKVESCDEIQLCGQALCLEEMLNVTIISGEIFYGRPRRRYEVLFDAILRQKTEKAISRLRDLYSKGEIPLPVYGRYCRSCSVKDYCLPKAVGGHRAGNYMKKFFAEEIRDSGSHDS